jgi:hypothetical protein
VIVAAPKRKRVVEPSITDDLLATREVWSEHMATIAPNALALASDVGKMAVDLADSPLGQRARRNPEITFAIAVLALGFLSRIFR